MVYKICFYMMLTGYLGLSLQTTDIKGKLIGIVLLIANALIFYK